MKKINTVAFRNKLTSLVDNIFFHQESYIIMKHGKPRAVIMSNEEYQMLIDCLRENERLREVK